MECISPIIYLLSNSLNPDEKIPTISNFLIAEDSEFLENNI